MTGLWYVHYTVRYKSNTRSKQCNSIKQQFFFTTNEIAGC